MLRKGSISVSLEITYIKGTFHQNVIPYCGGSARNLYRFHLNMNILGSSTFFKNSLWQ